MVQRRSQYTFNLAVCIVDIFCHRATWFVSPLCAVIFLYINQLTKKISFRRLYGRHWRLLAFYFSTRTSFFPIVWCDKRFLVFVFVLCNAANQLIWNITMVSHKEWWKIACQAHAVKKPIAWLVDCKAGWIYFKLEIYAEAIDWRLCSKRWKEIEWGNFSIDIDNYLRLYR